MCPLNQTIEMRSSQPTPMWGHITGIQWYCWGYSLVCMANKLISGKGLHAPQMDPVVFLSDDKSVDVFVSP